MVQQSLSERFDSIAMVLIESFVRTPHLLIIVLPSVAVSGSFLCIEEAKGKFLVFPLSPSSVPIGSVMCQLWW